MVDGGAILQGSRDSAAFVSARVSLEFIQTKLPRSLDGSRPGPDRSRVAGGGSHGAFTWGVLDRLLEESWLCIAGISGTSAGAMNAAVLADGWTAGGAAGARQALDNYWRSVSKAAAFSPLQRSPLDRLMADGRSTPRRPTWSAT